MTEREHKKDDHRVNAGTRRAVACGAMGVAMIALAALAAWRVHASRESPPANRLSPDAQKLVGRWMRTDAAYILEIQRGDEGELQAAYYNPRPINVSKTDVRDRDGQVEVFVELRDTGYPGSTYTLTYEAGRDLLYGAYFQAAMGQRYNVAFRRAPAETPQGR